MGVQDREEVVSTASSEIDYPEDELKKAEEFKDKGNKLVACKILGVSNPSRILI